MSKLIKHKYCRQTIGVCSGSSSGSSNIILKELLQIWVCVDMIIKTCTFVISPPQYPLSVDVVLVILVSFVRYKTITARVFVLQLC